MMEIDTTYRIDAPEIMDDFSLEGEELKDALDKIALINRLLGGNRVTLHGVQKLLQSASREENVKIVDVGCGNGDMLREIADFGRKNRLHLTLIGIDANLFTINHAKSLSVDYANITYRCEDIFDVSFSKMEYDIILCTLTLHHFKNNEILSLVDLFKDRAKIGVVINDLHRSKLAYRLFQIICLTFALKEMPRKDGLVSILRGFKKNELENFSKQLNLKNYTIQWRWAFRYQWIISNI